MGFEPIRDLYKIKNISELVQQMKYVGFQATSLAKAVDLIKTMKKENVTIYLAFTANMIASGLRGAIARLVKEGYADVIVTTGGAIEHDFIKSFEPYLLGDFFVNDVELHEKGINRIGNIFVPNERYELLESKLLPIYKRLYDTGKVTCPTEISDAIGAQIDDENSFLHWAHKKNIPVFSPGITDSAMGLQTYFFKQEYPDFGIDVTKDMHKLARITLNAEKTGAIVLGGGISKHHVIGANIVRGGLDYAVYVTTATQYDGSLSGAITNEAKSWGKIKEEGRSVTVHADATLVLPLIMGALDI